MFEQDPVQAREFFAQRLLYLTGPCELEGLIRCKERITVVDVRRPQDYRAGHIPGAINLPQGRWHTHQGLAKDRTTVLYGYSQTCQLGSLAAFELSSAGFAVVEMEGGFEAWQRDAREVAIDGA